ncbi:hypothetical protein [Rubrivivax sp. JA1026]|uniref:hypothetical protein n=1 Tax=Rubrivivax sp. JA1026 TaxID=2710888 RepID=UPI0013E952AD|nr:hypothetical protein [Rubrivivax sp. JA1026]
MKRNLAPRLAAALLVAGSCTAVWAQNTPPAGKAAAPASGRTLSLGGSGVGGGPLLTRAQLRDCLERRDAVAAGRAEVEAERASLDAERPALAAEQDSLKADREKLNEFSQRSKELVARYSELNQRVQDWNQRMEDLGERTGPTAEREKRKLDREKAEIDKTRLALDAERQQLEQGAQGGVSAFNARAAAAEAKVVSWNERNLALAERTEKLNAERDLWAGECANRRYREDDEILLKKGAK